MIILIQLVSSWFQSIGALVTTESAKATALANQTALAGCKVRLTQGSNVIAYSTTQAQLVANEATYDGYPAGGNTIATWGGPLANSPTGWVLSGETTFAYVDGSGHVSNVINAGWVETAGGELIFAFNLPTPVTLSTNGDGFVLQLQDVFGRGA